MPGNNLSYYKKRKQKKVENNIKEETQLIENQKITTEQSVKLNSFWFALISVLITFAVYLPTFQNTYTNWDDGHYVLENHLINKLDWQTIKKYFFSDKSYERYFMGNYHPLTMISLNLSYKFAKKDENGHPSPFPFQLGNIFFHLISILFIFLIIRKLAKNDLIAFLTSLFFGIHTLHVESVAWISERKDVLYTAFYFISLYLYILFVETKKSGNYIFSLFFFLLSLLSKGQAVTLAFSVVLIDIWYERKILNPKVLAEKIPYFILSIIFGLIAIEAQKYGSALQEEANYPLFRRFAIASYGFTMYLIKLVLPVKLSAIYPYPDIINKTVPFYFWLALIPVFIYALILVYAFIKHKKYLFFGLAFFVFNIIFLLQIIPVGGAIYADRYSYIPSVGIHFLISTIIVNFYNRKKLHTLILTSVYLILLIYLTINRIQVWKNSETLWEDTVAKQPKAVVAWNNYGSELNKKAQNFEDQGNINEFISLKKKAIMCFDTAIAQKPDYKSAFYNRAMTKYQLASKILDTNMMYSAIKDLDKALTIDPVFYEAFKQRGTIYDWLGDYKNALADYSTVIKLNPNDATSYVNRAVTYGKSGNYTLAIIDLKKAISLKDDIPEAYSNLGLAYYYISKYDSALYYLNLAINQEPNASAYFNRSLVFGELKQYDKAISDLNKTIELGRATPDVFYFIGLYKILSGKNTGCDDLNKAAKQKFQPAIIAWQKYCRK